MKCGGDHADDMRRAAILRSMIGNERKLMMDANQVWGVEIYQKMGDLAKFDPWWIEDQPAQMIFWAMLALPAKLPQSK